MAKDSQQRDRRIEAAVRSRLDHDDLWHIRSLARYEVAVAGGRATLTGHVRQRQTAIAMCDLAGRVDGVSSIEERLVADDELVTRVASTIGAGVLQRGTRLVVRAEFGRVRIGGAYGSEEARADALRVGAGVPGVVAVAVAGATDLIS